MNLNYFRKEKKESERFTINCEECHTPLKRMEIQISKKTIRDKDGGKHYFCLKCVLAIAQERKLLGGRIGQIIEDKLN